MRQGLQYPQIVKVIRMSLDSWHTPLGTSGSGGVREEGEVGVSDTSGEGPRKRRKEGDREVWWWDGEVRGVEGGDGPRS